MVKMAMIALRERIREDPLLRPCVWLIMQLHDEIVVELPTRLFHVVSQLIRSVMENIIPTASIPFTINIKVGPALGSLTDITHQVANKQNENKEIMPTNEKAQDSHKGLTVFGDTKHDGSAELPPVQD